MGVQRKMSDIMKQMMERLLRDPSGVPSSEASHVALFCANVAWNECLGLGGGREGNRNVWQTIEAEKPDLWDGLKSRDIDAMIDELVEYKKAHSPTTGDGFLPPTSKSRSTTRAFGKRSSKPPPGFGR